MRSLTPQEAAARVEKWAKAGFDMAVVDGLTGALNTDRQESISRAPHRSGALRGTIRVAKPSASRAARSGVIRASLAAGSRSRSKRAVPYARILQAGGRTRPHVIRAGRRGGAFLAFESDGRRIFARTVTHPGARYPALDYLRVNMPRLQRQIDTGLQKSADREIGR